MSTSFNPQGRIDSNTFWEFHELGKVALFYFDRGQPKEVNMEDRERRNIRLEAAIAVLYTRMEPERTDQLDMFFVDREEGAAILRELLEIYHCKSTFASSA